MFFVSLININIGFFKKLNVVIVVYVKGLYFVY